MSPEAKKGALHGLLERKKVLICCGSGGVGKTTTSAALALYAASMGYKTIVLTIDPAKRLANSLGIQKIDFQEKEIPKAELRRAGIEPKAPLFAMMLDTTRTFAALLLKYAPSEEKAQVILQNKLYQHLSNMIAGSQEYMAMEKLYEVVQERDYDLVVLDTPPSRHALDFLDAPTKMSAMVGDSVMKWFLKPSLFVSKSSLQLLDRSVKRVFRTFDKVAGFEFLQDLSQMLVSVSGLLEGFQDRAQKVELLLHDKDTGFLLVAAPQPIPLREAEYFYRKIQDNALPFAGFIFNRVQVLPEAGKPLPEGLKAKTRSEYQEMAYLFKSLAQRDEAEIEAFQSRMEFSRHGFVFKVMPQLERDIHDLDGLYELGRKLFQA
ncbi:ArsA family ATPase [Deltaproteobacteria bacterium PRO3]|nr:ArsA family ATPase [Deltaproteobacteria bacterium PRO3]